MDAGYFMSAKDSAFSVIHSPAYHQLPEPLTPLPVLNNPAMKLILVIGQNIPWDFVYAMRLGIVVHGAFGEISTTIQQLRMGSGKW